MAIAFDVLVLLIGLILFLVFPVESPKPFLANAKISRLGEIMFFCALLAICFGGDKVVAFMR